MNRRKAVALLMGMSILLGLSPANSITFADTKNVSPNSAPWVVSLWLVNDFHDRDGGGFFCTGSLINPTTVLTAAHCFYRDNGQFIGINEPFVVVRNQAARSSRGEVLVPRELRIHKYFQYSSLLNDIAVIDLETPATSSSYLRIPSRNQTAKMLRSKTRLFGWGLNQKQNLPNYLQSTRQVDVSRLAAQVYGDNFEVRWQIGAHRRLSTTRYSAACRGDSGGPLVGDVNGRKFALGIVSYGGDESCRTSRPVVFTRVAAYSGWVAKALLAIQNNRISSEFNSSTAFFLGTDLNPLPTSQLTNPDTSTSTKTEAVFSTVKMTSGKSDVSRISVSNHAVPQNGWDIEIQIHTRQAFVDGCDWDSSSLNGLRVSVKSAAEDWRAHLRFQYRNQFQTCLTQTPTNMSVVSPYGATTPAGCSTAIVSNLDGTVSVLMQRECLPDPANSYLRIWNLFGLDQDLEPGLDSWAGPFNLAG